MHKFMRQGGGALRCGKLDMHVWCVCKGLSLRWVATASFLSNWVSLHKILFVLVSAHFHSSYSTVVSLVCAFSTSSACSLWTRNLNAALHHLHKWTTVTQYYKHYLTKAWSNPVLNAMSACRVCSSGSAGPQNCIAGAPQSMELRDAWNFGSLYWKCVEVWFRYKGCVE